jgi:uridine kinase
MTEHAKIISDILLNKAKGKERIIIAIDGRCASGKTTLAKELSQMLNCNVIHMDDFFLRPEQRTSERLSIPGENVDHERFLSDVLLPLESGKAFAFRPFSCNNCGLGDPIKVTPKGINIIEGSYSCHPSLWEHYDLRIFLTVSPEEQFKRIVKRNGEQNAEVFRTRWIPLEEKYFTAFDIAQRCDIVLKNDRTD